MTQQYDRLIYRQEGLLKSLIKKTTNNSSVLVKYLHDYPAYSPPHKGNSIDLSVDQAEQTR